MVFPTRLFGVLLAISSSVVSNLGLNLQVSKDDEQHSNGGEGRPASSRQPDPVRLPVLD